VGRGERGARLAWGAVSVLWCSQRASHLPGKTGLAGSQVSVSTKTSGCCSSGGIGGEQREGTVGWVGWWVSGCWWVGGGGRLGGRVGGWVGVLVGWFVGCSFVGLLVGWFGGCWVGRALSARPKATHAPSKATHPGSVPSPASPPPLSAARPPCALPAAPPGGRLAVSGRSRVTGEW
jgi:hypothetical protein